MTILELLGSRPGKKVTVMVTGADGGANPVTMRLTRGRMVELTGQETSFFVCPEIFDKVLELHEGIVADKYERRIANLKDATFTMRYGIPATTMSELLKADSPSAEKQ